MMQLTDPSGILAARHVKQSTGTHSLTADKDGRYAYCFSNEFSTVSDKSVRYVKLEIRQDFAHRFVAVTMVFLLLVSFNVHGVIYVADDGTYLWLEFVHELTLSTSLLQGSSHQ